MVEAVRVGYITARDADAYRTWQRSRPVKREQGLSGEALEKAVMAFAAIHPDLVSVVR